MKKSVPALRVQNIKQAIEFYTINLGFLVPYPDGDFARLIRDQVVSLSTLPISAEREFIEISS